MAREFAQIRLTIWGDQDYTGLNLEQQGIYKMLFSQPTTNLAGVLDFLPTRLARLAHGLTAAKVTRLVKELEARDFVFLDEDTEEVLIRSMIRVSGAWKSPTSAKSIVANVEQTLSPKLKSILLSELHRAIGEAEQEGKWDQAATHLRGAADALTRAGIHPWQRGSGGGSAYPNTPPNALGVAGEGEGEGDVREGERHGAIERSQPEAFDEWWKHWRRKKAKGDAEKAFPNALKEAGLTALCEGATRYFDWIDRNNIEPRYIVGPGKWLRDKRWEDELEDRGPQNRARTSERIDGSLNLIQRLEQEQQWNSPKQLDSSQPQQLSATPSQPTTNE